MLINSLEKMERIVENNRALAWDGWTVVESNFKEYGAVSKNTVEEMLIGALELTRSDWSIAISGIAGPTGGTKDKPVGTVFIGVASKGVSEVREFHFDGNRDEVRKQSVDSALSMLLEVIDEKI